tara:strand:+ start:241 stop:528 length:288 start_codon:yes stop_codon:yes gene_type:complete
MAKRKTPKVDLTPRAEKITKEQLEKLQGIARSMDQMQLDLGIMETRKHSILHMIASSQNMLKELEQEFVKEYGTADINLADGTIKYNEDDNNKTN